MANLGTEELARIVRRDVPGYRLATPEKTLADSRTGNEVAPDAVSPDLDTLYQKYFGVGLASDEVAGYADSTISEPGRIERTLDADKERIVTIEPEHPRDLLDRGSRAKTVVVSTEKKRVIGFQG